MTVQYAHTGTTATAPAKVRPLDGPGSHATTSGFGSPMTKSAVDVHDIANACDVGCERTSTSQERIGFQIVPDPARDSREAGTAAVTTGPRLDIRQGPLLLDHISDAIFATDAGARITHWTVSAERLFGYSVGEAVGRQFAELLLVHAVHPGDRRELRAALKAERSWRGTGSIRSRDGREIWLDAAVDPIRVDGRLAGSVYVCRDITDIHDAQTMLAGEERFVSSVLDVVGTLVLVFDGQGRITRFNSACERLSGYDSNEVVGRAVWDVVIPPNQIDDVRTTFASLQAGAFPNAHENHWMTHTGELRLVSWQNTCLTDAKGAVTHVIATGIDITEARRRHEAMRGFETIGRLMAEHGPIPSALDAVLGEMRDRMGFRFLALYLDGGSGLQLAAQRGYRAAPDHLDGSQGIVGRVYRTGRAEVVSNVRDDKDYVPGDKNVASEVAVPLLDGSTTLGVLNLEAAWPDKLTEGDLQFARTIADRIASAVRRSHAQAALVNRTRLFTALAEFAVAVNAIREPGRLVAALVDAVGFVVPSDTVVITTLDRTDGLYRVAAVRGLSQDAVGAIIQPGEGTVGRAISERAVILSDRHSRNESTPALRDFLPYEAIRTVVVPLISEDTVLGVISVGRADTDATFTAAEREVFALLGAHAALALANAHLLAEVSALAIRDGLTGLYNRRYFDAELDLAVARFRRRRPAGKLAAIMFDLDHFGEFNRRHGHLAGDALLRLFGEILRERLRSADIVARYGGEEFVAILEDCGLAEAAALAEEVRRNLEARSVFGADGQSLHATVSAGCSMIQPGEPTRENLLGRADAGLFMAKEAGRNRVVSA
jgi:diguanylate cyclase (GGDEF)-like protein/PAS domain S-box-containing protein